MEEHNTKDENDDKTEEDNTDDMEDDDNRDDTEDAIDEAESAHLPLAPESCSSLSDWLESMASNFLSGFVTLIINI